MGTKGATRCVLKAGAGRKMHLAQAPEVMRGRRVGVEAAGFLHRASKRDPKEVCLHGVSQEAVLYVTGRLSTLRGEGATIVLVFDGDRNYDAKRDTHAERRKAREDAAAVPADQRTAKHWRAMATPQEPLTLAVMAWCETNHVEFMVAPYEADHQLVELQQAGLIDTILVSSDDSDLVLYGGVDCIYSWDPVQREVFWVKLYECILAPRHDLTYNFDGWTYDRLLVFALLSGHDYLPNIAGSGLKTVYTLMSRATLPDILCVALGATHPSIPDRPAAWRTVEALRAYAMPLLVAKLPVAEVEPYMLKLLSAYYAVRHHPVFKVVTQGLVFSRSTLATAVAAPLEPPPVGVPWASRVSGIRLHVNDDMATMVASGHLRADTLQQRVFAAMRQPCDLGSDSPGSRLSDVGLDAEYVFHEFQMVLRELRIRGNTWKMRGNT